SVDINTGRIENFSSIQDKRLYSENFVANSYLSQREQCGSFVQFEVTVIDQFDRTTSITEAVGTREFDMNVAWGFRSFLPLTELHDPERGYLTEEADCVKVVIHNQETKETEPIGITTLSPTQPSSQIVLSSSNIVYSQEEAMEALTKLDEALNMSAVTFYESPKLSPLKHAFKIIASFDCSSTTLTIEQKKELLAMEESLKELADRAAKAVYKEVVSEVKQVEQKLTALSAERKEIFRSCKKMKMELEALGKEWAEHEPKAKVLEEEEKPVEADGEE
ncbi:hypothetical protein Gogos_003748, partial [Gossypium gossypioides]|nr:hypothetical protein [Gossypium gossypioides]